jgi:hypothetical protein
MFRLNYLNNIFKFSCINNERALPKLRDTRTAVIACSEQRNFGLNFCLLFVQAKSKSKKVQISQF